jgi:hypothetical protein
LSKPPSRVPRTAACPCHVSKSTGDSWEIKLRGISWFKPRIGGICGGASACHSDLAFWRLREATGRRDGKPKRHYRSHIRAAPCQSYQLPHAVALTFCTDKVDVKLTDIPEGMMSELYPGREWTKDSAKISSETNLVETSLAISPSKRTAASASISPEPGFRGGVRWTAEMPCWP